MSSLARILAMWVVMLTTAVFAADNPWVGKTVAIKSSKEGAQGILIKGNALELASLTNAAPAACAFKILKGNTPENVLFESVGQPGMYLHHYGMNFILAPNRGGDAQWKIVEPLQGKQGVSLEHGLVAGRYLIPKDDGGFHVTAKFDRKRAAVFFLEER